MPLFDAHTKRLIPVSKTENFDLVQKFKSCSGRKFVKVERIIEEAVEYVVRMGGNVTWTRLAQMFGDNSPLPHADVRHVWEVLDEVFSGENDPDLYKKFVNMTLGGLYCWKISCRGENWLRDISHKDRYDPITGNQITFATYWIATNWAPPKKASVSDLRSKFSMTG